MAFREANVVGCADRFDVFVSLPGFRSVAAGHEWVVLKPGEAKDIGEVRLRDPKAAGHEP